MNITRIITLTPPRFSPEYIKEKVTCIRPHRERIFQVLSQIYKNKFVYHNYGQGGAGWTFLFGCVNESIRQFEHQVSQPPTTNKDICVIGAGCYGLLTAITLAHKGFKVKIIAKETHNITSDKAAGFFFPRARKSSTHEEIETFASLGIESYRIYKHISNGTHPFITKGAKVLPAYYGPDIDPGFAEYIKQGLMPAPEKVIINFGNGKMYDAMHYKTIFIDPAILMHQLRSQIHKLGITITIKEITTFDEIGESIIFNCTGLGAKKLADDKRLVPVQGHLIALKDQPSLEELQYMINFKIVQSNALGMQRDELIYFAPKESGILGITFIRGQDSLTANQHEFERLLQRCKDFFGV